MVHGTFGTVSVWNRWWSVISYRHKFYKQSSTFSLYPHCPGDRSSLNPICLISHTQSLNQAHSSEQRQTANPAAQPWNINHPPTPRCLTQKMIFGTENLQAPTSAAPLISPRVIFSPAESHIKQLLHYWSSVALSSYAVDLSAQWLNWKLILIWRPGQTHTFSKRTWLRLLRHYAKKN